MSTAEDYERDFQAQRDSVVENAKRMARAAGFPFDDDSDEEINFRLRASDFLTGEMPAEVAGPWGPNLTDAEIIKIGTLVSRFGDTLPMSGHRILAVVTLLTMRLVDKMPDIDRERIRL